jgi:hypothetical protein
LVLDLVDEVAKEWRLDYIRIFCRFSRAQGFVRVAAVAEILYPSVDGADTVVEGGTAEDLRHDGVLLFDVSKDGWASGRLRETYLHGAQSNDYSM